MIELTFTTLGHYQNKHFGDFYDRAAFIEINKASENSTPTLQLLPPLAVGQLIPGVQHQEQVLQC